MSARFKNSTARVQRATTHLTAFKVEWERVFADCGLTIVGRYDKDSGWYIARMEVPAATVERFENNSLALELGEYAYQLRSALDGLIWDAITFTQGSEPPANANGVYFPVFIPPITGRSKKFEDSAFLKYPFPDHLKGWLESIQPYQPVKPEGHPDRGIETALWDINDLARLDRHRRLRLVAAVPTTMRWGIGSTVENRIVARERIDTCDLLSGNYEFLRFKVETSSGAELHEFTLKTELAFEVLLEDIEPFGNGIDMGSQLYTYIQAVEYIIGRFDEQFT